MSKLVIAIEDLAGEDQDLGQDTSRMAKNHSVPP